MTPPPLIRLTPEVAGEFHVDRLEFDMLVTPGERDVLLNDLRSGDARFMLVSVQSHDGRHVRLDLARILDGPAFGK